MCWFYAKTTGGDIMHVYFIIGSIPFFDAKKITQADRAKVPKVTRNPHKQILFFWTKDKKSLHIYLKELPCQTA